MLEQEPINRLLRDADDLRNLKLAQARLGFIIWWFSMPKSQYLLLLCLVEDRPSTGVNQTTSCYRCCFVVLFDFDRTSRDIMIKVVFAEEAADVVLV